MGKTLQAIIGPKKPPETGFYYSYILTDNDRGLGEQVPLYAKMNEGITYNNGGAYEKISKHLNEEMQRNELMQRQGRGYYLPFYDQITLNFNVRANLRSNPNVYFWNAEPASERPANKIMVMPTFYDNDNNNSSMIKDAIGKSPNRIIVPLGLKWPDPGRPDLDHMTALVIEPKSNPPKIFFFNPFGESDDIKVNKKYKEMAQTAINKLKQETPGLQNAEVINSKATIEHDGSSCAVWSEWFISTMAAKSEVPMSGFNDSLNLLRANKSEGALNDYIRKRYEDNKRNFSVPAANIFQKQPPQPQARVEVSPPVRPTPISDKWQRVKNLPNNLPFYRGNSSNPTKSPQLDTISSNFFNVAQVKIPTGVYETRNPSNNYQIIVTPHSIGAQLKTNNGTPSNESLNDYRERVKKTMEFGADVMNLKRTGFEIATKSPFEDPKIYLSKIQITLEEAQRQNIKVKISAPDQAYLDSIYQRLSRNQNRSDADNKMMDTAKALVCGETPNVEPEVQPQRLRR